MMMMFVKVLVFTCACALGATDEVLSYGDIFDSIVAAYELLQENILSMDGNVPLLNDPRRHYAEIINVVYDEAYKENSCLGHDYYEDYQSNINISAPFAIANPQRVVDETKNLINDIIQRIDKVLQRVNASARIASQSSDKAIDEEIKKNVDKDGWSIDVLIATGIVATQLNQKHEDYFASSSQDLSAHSFVISGAQKLEKIVMAQKNLYQVLYRHAVDC